MSSSPIAKEIKQVSGFDSMADVKAAMPDNPDATGAGTPAPTRRTRKPRATPSPKSPGPVADPFLTDKRYQEACGRMAAFGGQGMIERGFDAGAAVLDDPKFKLNDKERLTWEDFFYVLSKKPLFDVGNPIYLALFFLVTLCAQLGWRIVERTESDFIKSLFTPKPKDEAPPEGVEESEENTLG